MSGQWFRIQSDLSSSPATPLFACPGLRSRWCSHTCHIACRTAAFQPMKTVGFPLQMQRYPYGPQRTYFGTQYTACELATPCFRHHLLVIALGFTTCLLAKHWHGRIYTCWVTSINFWNSTSFPRFEIYLDTINALLCRFIEQLPRDFLGLF